MKKILLTLLVLSTFLSTNAQKAKIELNLTLRDGNIVTGTSSISSIDLATDYGKLVIPIKNVSAIEIGITPDNSNKDKIIKLVNEMNNADEKVRQEAYSSALELGPGAIPVINNYMFSEKYVPSEYNDFTPEGVVNELKAIHNINDAFSEKDVVTIDYAYSMGGSYQFDKISLKTQYGDLTIPKNKIKKIDINYFEEGSGNDKTFKLIASKNISSNANGGWLNTGIMVKSGQYIQIAAKGEVTLASLSGNKYNPDGKVVGANNDYEDDYIDDYSSSTSTYPQYGNVVYKIGDKGAATRAGSNYKGVAKSSGILFLSIYETVYNASNSGFYTVKLSVK